MMNLWYILSVVKDMFRVCLFISVLHPLIRHIYVVKMSLIKLIEGSATTQVTFVPLSSNDICIYLIQFYININGQCSAFL